MPLELEVVGPSLKCDLSTCLVMVRSEDGTGKAGHTLITLIFDERAGLKHEQIVCTTTSDRAAKFIITMFDYDEDACVTRDSDKIGKSSIGDLTRTINKVQCILSFALFKLRIDSCPKTIFFICKISINPFPEGQDLLSKAHKTGARLSHSEGRCIELCDYESSMSSRVAIVLTKLDIDETRASSSHNLAQSILRLHKTLRRYFLGGQ